MNDTIRIQPHPVLKELEFPRKNLITLDITQFDPDSEEECYKAIQDAIKLNISMEVVIYEDTDGIDNNGKPIERISYSCPRCGKEYLLPYAYECPECKQRLKW